MKAYGAPISVMRDYQKFFVAYETYDPSVLADTPQFNFAPTLEEAQSQAAGMTPLFGGMIQITPCWVKFSPKAEVIALINGARSLGLFAVSSKVYYFEPDLRKKHFNSRSEL